MKSGTKKHLTFSRAIPVLMMLCLAACNSRQEKLIASFEKVNESLEETRSPVLQSVDELYQDLNVVRNGHDSLAKLADETYAAHQAAVEWIDYLLREMLRQDPTLNDDKLPGKLLVATADGDTLKERLLTLHHLIQRYGAANDSNLSAAYPKEAFQKIETDPRWLSNYFDDIPSMAAMTILKALKNNCEAGTKWVLSDIKKRMS